jgi:dTDP-4-amino-4,6-dideoxygalactose transaminase
MNSILTSLSPNTERDDIRLAISQLCSPWRWHNNKENELLEAELSKQLSGRPVVLTSSGRSALYYALKALGVSANDEVIIQAFTCVTVPASIQWLGAHPVYSDISEATYNLDPAVLEQKITPKTKAIIVQHTLGIPAPMLEIQEIVKRHNLLIIEDCAHALGATYQGQPVGTMGDISIFSFGRDKAISSVFGGAIACNNADVIKKIRAEQEQLPLPSNGWVVQQLLHPICMSVIMPLYFKANIGKAILVALQNMHVLSKAITEKERIGGKPEIVGWRLSPALAALARHQLKKLPHFIECRRKAADYYRKNISISVRLPENVVGASWLRLPITVPNSTKLHMYMRQRDILLGDWYDAAVAPRTVSNLAIGYTPDSCPVAEQLAASVVNLPTNHRLQEIDLERVVQSINDYFDDSRN